MSPYNNQHHYITYVYDTTDGKPAEHIDTFDPLNPSRSFKDHIKFVSDTIEEEFIGKIMELSGPAFDITRIHTNIYDQVIINDAARIVSMRCDYRHFRLSTYIDKQFMLVIVKHTDH